MGSFSAMFLHELKGRCDELIVLVHNYFFHAMGSYLLFTATNFSEAQQETFLHNLTPHEVLVSLGYLVAMVVAAFLTQLFQTKSIFLCPPALIMPFNYVSVIVGLLIDVFVLGATYNWLMVVGLIMASAGLFSKFILLYLEPPTAPALTPK